MKIDEYRLALAEANCFGWGFKAAYGLTWIACGLAWRHASGPHGRVLHPLPRPRCATGGAPPDRCDTWPPGSGNGEHGYLCHPPRLRADAGIADRNLPDHRAALLTDGSRVPLR